MDSLYHQQTHLQDTTTSHTKKVRITSVDVFVMLWYPHGRRLIWLIVSYDGDSCGSVKMAISLAPGQLESSLNEQYKRCLILNIRRRFSSVIWNLEFVLTKHNNKRDQYMANKNNMFPILCYYRASSVSIFLATVDRILWRWYIYDVHYHNWFSACITLLKQIPYFWPISWIFSPLTFFHNNYWIKTWKELQKSN